MGLFLCMSGVVGAKQTDVEKALEEYAAARGGRFEPTTKRSPSWEVLILGESDGNTTVVYPGAFMAWDLEEDDPGKAYEDDEFASGDCWQLVDFMRKLGLP